MDQSLINRIVEAALLAASSPLSLAQLRELFPEDQPAPQGAIEAAIAQLQLDCRTRGVELVEVASGFRYQVRADVHPWVARLWTERQTRYTRATLETLALIAYRQPITRGEIEQVRGVSVSSNIIKALEEREWIRVVGHRDVPGRPALFGTTRGFLDYFGLKRLDELPPLSELKDIGELEPQLQFDDAAGVAPSIAVGGVGEEGGAGGMDGDASGIDDDSASVADRAADGDGAAVDAEPADVDEADVPGDDDDTITHAETAAADEAAGVRTADDASAVSGTVDDDATDDETDLDFRSERPIVFEDDGVEDDDETRDSDAGDAGVDPEAAPGTRVATENDHEQDNAVETTTVPALTTASSDAAESERNE